MNRAAYTAVRESFRLGMTEKDVEQLILDAYRRVAGDSFTFCGDIVGGKRSADIEGGATDYVLQTGDALILDLQPQIDGVFCEAGACPEAIFSFRGETQGALQIRNIHALETKCVVRSEGALNVELENCRVEKITGAL